jgi:spore coat protein U-like protein
MSLNTRYPVRGLAATMFFCTALPVTADITGTIDATITLTSGCVINSGNEMDGASGVSFGSLDFGTQPTLFTSADSQVTGGATGIEVQCTAGVAPRLVFQSGLNDGEGSGAGNRAMHDGSGNYVTYNLFLDAGYASPLSIGADVTLEDDGSAQVIAVYGRAYGAAALPADTYDDVITVLLEL